MMCDYCGGEMRKEDVYKDEYKGKKFCSKDCMEFYAEDNWFRRMGF